MNRLHQVTDALMAILESELPTIKWQEKPVGAAYPTILTGTVSCGALKFERISKLDTNCSASFVIYLINPSKADADNPRKIEGLALDVQNILSKNSDLDGWASDCNVLNIVWGTAPGRVDIGMAVINITIDFDTEQEE